MNIVDRIKKLFKIKKEVEETTTTISLYDVSDIIVPRFNELSKYNQDKVIKYQQEINIKNQENIIQYNQDISKEGERLSNLLIKYLYELNDVIRKDNKTKYELEEININSCIQNMKMIVIRDLLQELLQDSYFRLIAIKNIKDEYQTKEHIFIEIFSKVARIKRNMDLRSMDEAITRCKIGIKTLEQQLNAVNNTIKNHNIITNKTEIYNKINDKANNLKKEIILNKIKLIIKVHDNLNCKFSKYEEIIDILKEEKIDGNEQRLIELIAISEIELDKYILKNNDLLVSEYITKITELKDIKINHENESKLLSEIKRLQVIREVFKDYIEEPFKEDIYIIKFNLLTYDINEQNDIYTKFQFINKNDNELKYYYDIIRKKINNINQEISPVAIKLNKEEEGNLNKMIKLLNNYLKSTDGKYRYEDILVNRQLLALLLAFDSEEKFDSFFKEYKLPINNMTFNEKFILPTNNFEWEEYIPLETIYTLYEVDRGIVKKLINIDKNKPLYYEIYRLYYGTRLSFVDVDPSLPSYSYMFPTGIKEIHDYHGEKKDKLMSYLTDRLYFNYCLILPSSLKRISGNLFSGTLIKEVQLNEGLEYIGQKVFMNQEIEKISFPKSLYKIELNSFNFKELKEIEFQDYKESKLLYSLLYNNDSDTLSLINKFFRKLEDENHKSYIYSFLDRIILCDSNDDKIELTKLDMEWALNIDISNDIYETSRIQYNLSNLIEKKTGINLKKYREGKSLK